MLIAFSGHYAWSTEIQSSTSAGSFVPLSGTEESVEAGREESLFKNLRRTGDRVKSVQHKFFLKTKRHELGLVAFSISLNDPFYYNFAFGLDYSYHIYEWLGFQARFNYFTPPVGTGSVRIVRSDETAISEFKVPQFKVSVPQLNFHVDAQFSPIYGKMSLFSQAILHYDLYAAVGVGAMKTTGNQYSGFQPMGTFAIGGRVFLLKWLTLRLEIRDYLYPDTRSEKLKETSVQNLIMFNIGASVFFPTKFSFKHE